MRRVLTSVTVAAMLVAAACGGKGSSPTAPSNAGSASASPSPSGPPAGSSGGSNEVKGLVEALPPTTPALTFKAAGRTIVTNASTVFVKGGIARTFEDLGIGSRVEVRGSSSGDTLTASRVEIEEQQGAPGPNPGPNPGQDVEITGLVSNLTGTAASFQFNVGSQLVKGTSATELKGHNNAPATFADLKNGVEVDVDGERNTDGSIQADEIEIELEPDEDEDEEEDEVEIRGTIAGLTGTASSFTFTLNGTTVKGDSTTEIETSNRGASGSSSSDGHSPLTFADLKNGQQVQVKGTRNTDNSVQADRIRVENAIVDDEEVKVEGSLGAVTGTCPAISSTVAGTKFTASASTRFDNPCSSFASGRRVEVRGHRQSDGSLAATRLRLR